MTAQTWAGPLPNGANLNGSKFRREQEFAAASEADALYQARRIYSAARFGLSIEVAHDQHEMVEATKVFASAKVVKIYRKT